MTLYMVCPYCNKEETNVIDSRKNNEGNSIRRRRECPKCDLRFTTYEKADIGLMVQKRSGEIQEFDYEKLYKGIENAFGGLDINEKKLKTLVDNVHNEIKSNGNKVKTELIGETVLSHLKETNKVAYLRFASVYKEFSDASDFEKEVAEL